MGRVGRKVVVVVMLVVVVILVDSLVKGVLDNRV